MSDLEYMTYVGFGSANAGVAVLVGSTMHELAFGLTGLVYCAFAAKTLNEDKHE